MVLDQGKARMVINGEKGPAYDQISPLIFSPDGRRTLYMAKQGEQWTMVTDGKEGTFYDGVALPTFSPDAARTAFLAKTAQGWTVCVDGQEGRTRFAGVLKGARLVFDTPDRLHTLILSSSHLEFLRLDITIHGN